MQIIRQSVRQKMLKKSRFRILKAFFISVVLLIANSLAFASNIDQNATRKAEFYANNVNKYIVSNIISLNENHCCEKNAEGNVQKTADWAINQIVVSEAFKKRIQKFSSHAKFSFPEFGIAINNSSNVCYVKVRAYTDDVDHLSFVATFCVDQKGSVKLMEKE